jgi:hypothetical protein
VPLSKCTFLPLEVITEPCVLLPPAALKLKLFRPTTPRLFEFNWPAPFKPPAVLRATPDVEFTVESAAPPAAALVLFKVPAAPVAAPLPAPAIGLRPVCPPDPPMGETSEF